MSLAVRQVRILTRMRAPPPVPPAARRHVSRPMTLPRLPVPDLGATLDRYLTSIEPLLLEDEAQGGRPAEETRRAHAALAESFRRRWGEQCQARLVELDKRSPQNWLDDNIWLQKAYLEYRAPLLINSNWWLALQNDDTVPAEVTNSRGEGITPWQVRRAAWMLHRTLDFKAKLDSQEIYPDTTRTGLWFRRAALAIFESCRTPAPGADELLPIPPHTPAAARRVLVLVYDWLYAIDVYAYEAVGGGSMQAEVPVPLSPRELEKRMIAVVNDAHARLTRGERAVPVGVLTADERGRWAENLAHLLSIARQNEATLHTVQHALLAVSLDHYTNPHTSALSASSSALPLLRSASSSSSFHPASPSTTPAPTLPPTPVTEPDAHLHHARSPRRARNRWFDRPFTLALEANARCGVNGEHSPVDALVPSVVAEYAVVASVDPTAFGDGGAELPLRWPEAGMEAGTDGCRGWGRLDWITDEHIERECAEAEDRAARLIADSDDSVLWFDDYGAAWIKNVARLAPDGFIQMALQLAWYRDQRYFTPTYETALTRLFRHGRTETIRTLTARSRAWVLAMVDPSSSTATRVQLLHQALLTHASLTRAAATGKGIDRHLLGLRCMLPEDARPELFVDPMFERSQHWRLSTSGLSEGHLFRGTGFGSPYTDGYGVNYLAGPDVIKFGIESQAFLFLTSTAAFKLEVVESLRLMRGVLEDSAAFPQPQYTLRAHL